MDINVVLGVLVAGVVGFYVIKAVSRPIAELGKALLRSMVAFFVIWAANVVGALFGFHMGLNLVSALTVGILGIPGVALLLAVKYLV